MITDELEKKIASFFGMPRLNTASRKEYDEDGSVIGYVHPLLIWTVQIQILNSIEKTFHNLKSNEVTVCVVQSDKWRKGLLLIPPIKPPYDREFGGPLPLKPVDVSDMEDQVVERLKCVDLTYTEEESTFDGQSCWFHMLVHTTEIYTDLHVSTTYGDKPKLDSLWDAILAMMSQLAEKYNDGEMLEFFRKEPFWDYSR